MPFGFDNENLDKRKSPFGHVNTDSGPAGLPNNVIQIPREFGLTQNLENDEDFFDKEGSLTDLPSGII